MLRLPRRIKAQLVNTSGRPLHEEEVLVALNLGVAVGVSRCISPIPSAEGPPSRERALIVVTMECEKMPMLG
jgi:hypothetical protein